MAELEGAVCLICATDIPPRIPQFDFPDTGDHITWYPSKWMEDVILLYGPTWPNVVKGPPSMSIPDENVTVHDAHVSGSKHATISTDLQVLMQTSDRLWWYLPVHAACYTMAKKAMAAPGSKITSLGDLWMTLERRCRKTVPYWRPAGFCIPAIPNNRPGEPIELGLGRYYISPQAICPGFPSIPIPKYGFGWWSHDPLRITYLTEALMSTLERAESPLADAGFSKRFDSLPPEIGNIVIEDLIACVLAEGGSSLECTYLIPQYRWKQALIHVPFLWDLKNEVVERKDQEATAGLFEWNWEKFARLVLSEFPIFREGEACGYKLYSQSGHGVLGLPIVPPAFANRRRIWQILMDMYPNDAGMFNRMG